MAEPFVINADLKEEYGHIKKIKVTSNDTNTFTINILDNGIAADLTNVTTVSLANTRLDKEVVVTEGSITGTNQVTFNLGTNETAVAGRVDAVVQLYDAEGRVSTLAFSYEVKTDPTGSGFIPSISEQTLIQVVLGDGPLILEDAVEAAAYANEQGAYVDSKRELIDTFTGEQTNLQAQLDVLVIDGDSSPESAQARVGSNATVYPTLKARLDAEKNETTALLADTSKNMPNPYEIGLDGKSLADVGELMQQYINMALDRGIRKLTFPKGDYYLSRLLNVAKDDIILDFQGSTLHWIGTASVNNRWGEYGIINVYGTLVGGDAKTYIKTLDVGMTHLPPVEAPVLTSLDTVNVAIGAQSSRICGRVNTSNNAYFAVGDFMWIQGWTRATLPYVTTAYEPEIRVITKVLAIDAGYIYVDYITKFDFSMGFINNGTVKSRAMKVIPVNDVEVLNVNFIDESSTSLTPDRWVSGVSVFLANRPIVKNIYMKQHKFSVVYPYMCYEHNFENLRGENATKFGGGQGYVIQHIGCTKGKTKNVTGIKCRHVIDYSWSTYCKAENASSIDGLGLDLDLHGCGEHDIEFVNCNGVLGLGNGIANFSEIIHDIKFTNCKLRPLYSDTVYVNGLEFVNCDIESDAPPFYVNSKFINTVVKTNFGRLTTQSENKRGKTFVNKVLFDNSKLIYTVKATYASDTHGGIDLYEFVNNSEIIAMDAVLGAMTNLPQVKFLGVTEFKIKNSLIKNATLMLYFKDGVSGKIAYENNLYNVTVDKTSTLMCQLVKAVNCTLDIRIKGNTVQYDAPNAANNIDCELIIAAGTLTSSVANLQLNENTMYGAAIRSRASFITQAGLTVNNSNNGNIVKNRISPSAFSDTGNILIV